MSPAELGPLARQILAELEGEALAYFELAERLRVPVARVEPLVGALRAAGAVESILTGSPPVRRWRAARTGSPVQPGEAA